MLIAFVRKVSQREEMVNLRFFRCQILLSEKIDSRIIEKLFQFKLVIFSLKSAHEQAEVRRYGFDSLSMTVKKLFDLTHGF